MKTLAHPADLAALHRRLDAIRPDSPRKFGRMTVEEMLCHLADQLRFGTGEIRSNDTLGTVIHRTLVKWLVLRGMPAPPERVKTMSEIDQAAGRGTRPVGFDHDLRILREMMDEFAKRPHSAFWQRHPMFGEMSADEWKRMAWIHIDHHLKQFGA